MNNIQIPSGKYFISHSYKDADVRDKMIERLPNGVEPYIFPPISVSPLEFVSSTLIGSILTCDGMIYLNEGFSAKSFWVAFERDYALRAQKPVFSFTPSRHELTPHTSAPLDLAIFPIFFHRERERVMKIIEFMRHSRFFDPWIDTEKLHPGSLFPQEIGRGLEGTLQRGGCIVSFWTQSSMQGAWIQEETVRQLDAGRALVAAMDNSFPSPRQHDPYYVQIVDEHGLNHNRVDDLIVRLYWLIFRNQFPELVYE